MNLLEQGDGSEKQCVVGERGKELRCKDSVEAAFHVLNYCVGGVL
jgi:hypothetical protein